MPMKDVCKGVGERVAHSAVFTSENSGMGPIFYRILRISPFLQPRRGFFSIFVPVTL